MNPGALRGAVGRSLPGAARIRRPSPHGSWLGYSLSVVGRTLNQYRIVERLGQGGMGEVYLAEDQKLGRRVALKVLPEQMASEPTRLERFEREARAVAALSHPGIVTIHSVEQAEGVHFLTMELAEGEPLDRVIGRGGLDLGRLFDIAVPLADALAAAHARGIAHRDLKPANVMVGPEGRVKVLDFGLAKMFEHPEPAPGTPAEQEETRAADESLTKDGVVVGTVPYMAPEQLQGKAVDHRADIFSLGVMLYEMATGRRPFGGDSSVELMSSILRDNPQPVQELRAGLPRHLGRIIRHCLEKDPERRYQSVLDVRNELQDLRREVESGELDAPAMTGSSAAVPAAETPHRPSRLIGLAATVLLLVGAAAVTGWLLKGRQPAPAGAEQRQSIAVLPFQNLSGDESIDYLRLAVPDEITTALSRAPSLSVRPFAMTARYAGAVVDPGQASRELGAANIVTGQYFKQGQQLHLTLEAIDVEESRVLWRESLPVQSDDLIALRRTVAGRIESGLLPQLGAAAPGGAGADLPENPEAYRLFMRGLGTGKDPQPNKRAIELLEQAVALEDTYAPAWAELSVRYYYDGNYAFGGHEAHDRAEQAARRALELDPTLTGASLRLIVLQVEKGDLTGAYDEATTLLARNPSSPEAHFVLGYVLRYAGLLDEALRECDAALALDPTNPGWRSCGITAYMAGEYDRARQFLALDASSEWSRSNQIGVALRTGELGRAAEIGRTLPQDPFGDWLLACIENRPVPDPEFAAQYEQFWSTVRDSEQLYWSASMLAFCDEPERALRMLRAAIEKNYCSYPLLNNDPLLGAVRALPGFADVREQARACRERFLAHRAARRSG